MSDNQEHENAETRRQERREHDKEEYRREGIEMRQGGPDPNLPHHERTHTGEGFYSPDSTADTGSSDGVSSVISGDGGNTPGRHAELNPDTTSSSPDGTKGAGSSSQPHLHTPSAQSSHTAKGPRGDGGQGKAGGSKSGKQS